MQKYQMRYEAGNVAYDEERNHLMRQVVELEVKDTKLLLLLYSICTKSYRHADLSKYKDGKDYRRKLQCGYD